MKNKREVEEKSRNITMNIEEDKIESLVSKILDQPLIDPKKSKTKFTLKNPFLNSTRKVKAGSQFDSSLQLDSKTPHGK